MQRPATGTTRDVLAALLAFLLLAVAGHATGPAVVSAGPQPGATSGAGHVDDVHRRDAEPAVGRQATAVASHARTQAQRDHLLAGAAVLPAGLRTAAPVAGRRDAPAPVAPARSTAVTGWDSRAPPA
jgi:hypothetical protein